MDQEEILAQRNRILAIAKTWLGTRFIDCQRKKIVKNEEGIVVDRGGVDCMQFIWAVFHEAGLTPFMEHEKYSPQWYLHRSEEKALSIILDRACITERKDPANLIVYRVGRAFAHAALILEWPKIIHANKRVGRVEIAPGNEGILLKRPHILFTIWPD